MAVEKGMEKGINSKDKGVFIPKDKRAPYSPQYLHMSKKDVVEAERKRKENDLKAAQFRADLEKKVEAPKSETPKVEEKKKAGKPKRIE